jgi:hypothetical protein
VIHNERDKQLEGEKEKKMKARDIHSEKTHRKGHTP